MPSSSDAATVLVEQRGRGLDAHRRRVGPGGLGPQHRVPVERREQDLDLHAVGGGAGERPARQVAAAAELGEERPLGGDGGVGVVVGDRARAARPDAVVVGAALHGDRALAHLGQHHATGRAARRCGRRGPRRSRATAATTTASKSTALSSRVADVAAQLAEGEVGTGRGELRPAADGAGADAGTGGQARRAWTPTSASRVSPRSGTAREHESGRGDATGGPWPSAPRRRRRPASTASWTSLTNTPVPPSAWIGASVRRSPVVVTTTTSASTSPSRAMTRCGLGAGELAATRRDAHGAPTSLVVAGRLQREELGERVDVEVAPRRAGGVLESDGRLVQQLVDAAPE